MINLNKNEIFVFGSNLQGRHGRGAALEAIKNWGAVYGIGHGLVGNSYAIPTKDEKLKSLSLKQVEKYINIFVECAELYQYHPVIFLVTRIGCGLAGYKDEQMAPMFINAPPNCQFSNKWYEFFKGQNRTYDSRLF